MPTAHKECLLTWTCHIKTYPLAQTARYLCCAYLTDSSRRMWGRTSGATGKQQTSVSKC